MIQHLLQIYVKLLTKSDKATTYKYDVDVFLSSLQAGIDRRVLINAADINTKFTIAGASNDTLKKVQKVDGSTLYDALELSFNSIDKTSILQLNKVDILQYINNKVVINDVYNKSDIDLKCSSLIGAAPAILNTIVELAAALGNDSNYDTHIQNQTNNKVDI